MRLLLPLLLVLAFGSPPSVLGDSKQSILVLGGTQFMVGAATHLSRTRTQSARDDLRTQTTPLCRVGFLLSPYWRVQACT